MGLGLFIAKTLLERSGAQLRFTNGTGRNTAKPKCGAVIEVVWPRATLELQPQGETEKMGKNQQITNASLRGLYKNVGIQTNVVVYGTRPYRCNCSGNSSRCCIVVEGGAPPCPDCGYPNCGPTFIAVCDGVLHHASTAALKKFAFFPGTHVWEDLRACLLGRFPDFPETAGTRSAGSMTLLSKQANDRTTVEVNWRDGMCWVHLTEPPIGSTPSLQPNMEAGQIDRFARTMAQPVWEMDAQGHVGWRNMAFDRLAERIGTEQSENPFSPFETSDQQRCMVTDSKGVQDWFEVTTQHNASCHLHHSIGSSRGSPAHLCPDTGQNIRASACRLGHFRQTRAVEHFQPRPCRSFRLAGQFPCDPSNDDQFL
ncbi:Sensor histidine kinase RegB [Nymphon striatum]|nr:Sensor histidine kinase RegB [Nymphon striatum]